MTAHPKILAFTGSLRAQSHNRSLLLHGTSYLKRLGATVTEVELRTLGLPLFDEDFESELVAAGKQLPAGVVTLQDMMLEHDGLLLACPEYNSSITPALKNAIDWSSRRVDDKGPLACFRGKVAGLMAASPGKLGGIRGLPEVRRILSNIGVTVVPGDYACPSAHEALPADGQPDDAVLQGVHRVCENLFHATSALQLRGG